MTIRPAQETGSGSDSAPPLMSEVGVLALVPDTWGSPWQPRHHVMTRLARYFRVVWMNPPPYWRDALAYARTPRNESSEPGILPGFEVYYPEAWLPTLYRPRAAARLAWRARLERGIRLLRQQGCRRIIFYIWRPEFAGALDLAGCDLSCYHVDDEYAFANEHAPLSPAEIALLRRVNQVFIHSPGLLRRKGKLNPHTAFVPNDVDYDLFSASREEPADLRPIPHPRIGYNGYIKRQLDWSLLLDLARNRPAWSFVFVGPLSPHPDIRAILAEIRGLPNVWFLGAKPWRELGAYAQHFDVCLMPYDRRDGSANYIFPLKLHEYLAAGQPVVGARIQSLEEFQDIVPLAAGTEQWMEAIERSLEASANSPESRAARQAVARRYDWNVLVERIARTLAARIEEKYGPGATAIHLAREAKGSPEEARYSGALNR